MSESRLRSERFRAATEAADHEGLRSLLTDNVELHSPVLSRPFIGRDAVSGLLSAARRSFEHIHHPLQMSDGEDEMLLFDAAVKGREIQGVVLLKFDGELVRDLTVFIRPLRGTAAFAAAIGSAVARNRRRALLMRLTAPGMLGFAGTVDRVARRSLKFT